MGDSYSEDEVGGQAGGGGEEDESGEEMEPAHGSGETIVAFIVAEDDSGGGAEHEKSGATDKHEVHHADALGGVEGGEEPTAESAERDPAGCGGEGGDFLEGEEAGDRSPKGGCDDEAAEGEAGGGVDPALDGEGGEEEETDGESADEEGFPTGGDGEGFVEGMG